MSTLVYRRRMNARRRQQPKGRGGRVILILLLALGALGSIAAAAGVGSVFAVYQRYADDYVPIEDKLRQTNIGLTEIYDRGGPDTGVKLGDLTNPDQQLLNPIPLNKISPWLIQATVSTEDNSFFENPGVNVKGIFRAAYENYVKQEFGGGTGGSSITQQLIKNVYICPNIGDEKTRCESAERTLDRKLREIVYAIELNKDYSKEHVLELYLNQISYADRYVGIQAAAQGYFHKDALDLTFAESALLAGVVAYPTLYHPRLNCVRGPNTECVLDAEGRSTVAEEAKKRQELVIDLMVRHARATEAEAEAAKVQPVLVYQLTNPIKAGAFIDNQVEPRLVRMCEVGILPQIKGAADCTASVHAAGYKVTTTLDWKETAVAQEMIRGFIDDGLSKGCNCYNAALVTIEPSTGQVIIYAPNRDASYTSDPRADGRIDQLNEINQPGSSFKPAVYLNWFDTLGKSPANIFWDTSPLKVEGTEIVNPRPGGGGEGLITARAALGGSQNVGAFRAAQEGGVDNVIAMAKKLGITTLDQHFDPTFRAHPDVDYGASIATGGANIRAIDMAYMDATISNMGMMVGVPHNARTVELKDLKSTAIDKEADYYRAVRQRYDFARGNIRIPGTRELDPVVILQVLDKDGKPVYTHTPAELQKKQVVDAGSVWLLHSIMSDCTARVIIWGCGGSNNDLALDFFTNDGVKIPGGVKTGTQQGPKNAVDTLETWMTGYSRYAATALWVGNANNDLVRDGPQANYASANTTVKLFKNWMGEYHTYLQRNGVFTTPAGFGPIQPKNVAQRSFETPATDRTIGGKEPGGCEQTVTAWVRTDVKYASECEEKDIDTRNGLLSAADTPAQFRTTRKFVKLPGFHPELAQEMVKDGKFNIAIAPTEKSTGNAAVSITSPRNGQTIGANSPVLGTVRPSQLKTWKLELGVGSLPAEWKTIGGGNNPINEGTLGTIDLNGLADGVYTLRLSAEDGVVKNLVTSVTFNIRKGAPNTGPTPGPGATPPPGSTPTPPGPTATKSPFPTPRIITPQLPR